MSLLRTLLILSIIYFLYRIFTQVIMPLLFRAAVNKAQERFEDELNRKMKEQQTDPHVRVDGSGNNKRFKEDVGEYVDYEEVK